MYWTKVKRFVLGKKIFLDAYSDKLFLPSNDISDRLGGFNSFMTEVPIIKKLVH